MAADLTTTITANVNLKLEVVANGPLDGPPAWESVGIGSIQVAGDGMSAIYATSGAGTNTVTVTAHSFGNTLTKRIIITVNPVPATVLSISATVVAK